MNIIVVYSENLPLIAISSEHPSLVFSFHVSRYSQVSANTRKPHRSSSDGERSSHKVVRIRQASFQGLPSEIPGNSLFRLRPGATLDNVWIVDRDTGMPWPFAK